MKKATSLLVLLAAGLTTVLGVAGLSVAASQAPPRNQSLPTISGTPRVGSTLSATSGSWTGTAPISYSYQWRRCARNGGSCSNISGATGSTYTLRSADRGTRLRVRVTARNAEGSAQAQSAPTAIIQGVPGPAPTGCPGGSGPINVAALAPPARLLINAQQSSPAVITRSTSTLVLRFHVVACGGRPVQGALVYATAVPFEQFNVPPEATTGADGWATLTTQRASRFPASPVQQLLAVFARARKPGESLLGGVSTRILVSFPVSLRR